MPAPHEDGLPADEAKLVSILVQSIIFGIYTVFFVECLLTLKRRKRRRVGMGVVITMWILAAMHLGVDFTRIIHAFVLHKHEAGGPAGYFNILSNFTHIFGSAVFLLQTLIGDAVLMWRSLMVRGLDWRVMVFPAVLFLGSATCAVGILREFVRIAPGVIFRDTLSRWITSFFVLTLATNLVCTSLIATKIWRTNRYTASLVIENKLRHALPVVIESGAIYSCAVFILLITYLSGSWASCLLLDAVSSLLGIIFGMLILQLGIRFSENNGELISPDENINIAPHGIQLDSIKLHVPHEEI